MRRADRRGLRAPLPGREDSCGLLAADLTGAAFAAASRQSQPSGANTSPETTKPA